MLDMTQIERMRDLAAEGFSPSEVKRATGASYPTIRKYLAMDDFNEPRPVAKGGRPSKFDPFKADVADMIDEDRRCYRKQRHTAKRIYERLRDEHGYDGSYSTVRRYVAEIRSKAPRDRFVRLEREPGDMQIDFGQADFDCAFGGGRVRMHYLPMSFPHSNHALCQVYGDEKAACVCQAPRDAFERIGGVPRRVVADNATEIGRRWRDEIVESDLFGRFRMHYGFQLAFCNPNSGHEKGNVEGGVGWVRRNLFVPVREIGDLREFNAALMREMEARSAAEPHYEKGLTWMRLFEGDRAALLPLPRKPFDVVKWETRTADGYGRVRVGDGHWHLASPELAGAELAVGARAYEVEVLSPDGSPLRTYRRRTGPAPTSDEGPMALFDLLAIKTRAFGRSSVRAMFTEGLRARFDAMARDELKGQIETMAEMARTYTPEVAVGAFERTFSATGRTRSADVGMTAARIADGGRRAAAAAEHGTRLIDYDEIINERRGHAHQA